jgi:hypothetical protein
VHKVVVVLALCTFGGGERKRLKPPPRAVPPAPPWDEPATAPPCPTLARTGVGNEESTASGKSKDMAARRLRVIPQEVLARACLGDKQLWPGPVPAREAAPQPSPVKAAAAVMADASDEDEEAGWRPLSSEAAAAVAKVRGAAATTGAEVTTRGWAFHAHLGTTVAVSAGPGEGVPGCCDRYAGAAVEVATVDVDVVARRALGRGGEACLGV